MPQQTLTVVVDSPDDQQTAVETAAAQAVESIQSAGVVVIAATFGGTSLLPTPAEALRSAVEELQALIGANGTPTKAALQAATAKVDAAAAVVEALGIGSTPEAPAAPTGGVALPDEPTPAPAGTPDVSAASYASPAA